MQMLSGISFNLEVLTDTLFAVLASSFQNQFSSDDRILMGVIRVF